MTNDDYQHFVCVVAGENPEEIIKRYKIGKVEPYVAFRFADAEKLRQQYLDAYRTFIDSPELSPQEQEMMRVEYELTEEENDVEFFARITEGYKHDEETGDAIDDENPDGEYTTAERGKYFSVPLLLLNGEESFSARKKEIDWDKIHLSGQEPYSIAWETVMEHRKPENEYEENIYKNMKDYGAYLKKFGDKETYLVSSTAFWGYAFVSDKVDWQELRDNVNQFEWVSKFYERFIEPLSEDTLITIFECRK